MLSVSELRGHEGLSCHGQREVPGRGLVGVTCLVQPGALAPRLQLRWPALDQRVELRQLGGVVGPVDRLDLAAGVLGLGAAPTHIPKPRWLGRLLGGAGGS